jgi:hypothetical protein
MRLLGGDVVSEVMSPGAETGGMRVPGERIRMEAHAR